jgi:hypothetical protein
MVGRNAFGTGMYNMPIGALITGIGQRAGNEDGAAVLGSFDFFSTPAVFPERQRAAVSARSRTAVGTVTFS